MNGRYNSDGGRRLLWRQAIFTIILCLTAFHVLAEEGPAQSFAGTRKRRAMLEKLFVHQGPSVRLSTVYNAIPQEKRLALLAKLKAQFLSQVPGDVLDNPAFQQLPPQVKIQIEDIISFIDAVTPEQMDEFIRKQDLDHLLPIPPVALRLYHDAMDNMEVPGKAVRRIDLINKDKAEQEEWIRDIPLTPGYRSKSDPRMDRLVLLGPDDQVPADEIPQNMVSPSGVADEIVKADFLADLPPRSMVNSTRLARAFNHLTNPSYADHPMKVRLPGGGRGVHEVRDGVELYDLLMATGRWDAMLFDGRMFVDFCGYWIKKGGGLLPVRIPTWVATGIDPDNPADGRAMDGRSFIVPANHSEHLLVFFDASSGKPAMLVRWYMGLPGGHDLAQGTRFKPAIWQRASWSDYRVVRSYRDPEKQRLFIRAASAIMRMFNYVQWKLRYPMNGYNVLSVCQDTTGLIEGILLGGKEVTVWPLSRDPDLDFYYAAIKPATGVSPDPVLGIPSDARPDLYPWILQRKVLLRRIGMNIPTRRPGDLHFRQVTTDLQVMMENSPTLRKALKY